MNGLFVMHMLRTSPAKVEVPDINDAIRSTAMLVSYHTTAWHARIPDPDAAKAAAAALGITISSSKSSRDLMDGYRVHLKAVTDIQKAGRNIHNHLTLPWTSGKQRGPRMLPTTSWMQYMREIAAIKTSFDAALANFVQTYPADRDAAQKRVQMVGDPLHLYPKPEALEAMFTIKLDFTPIPAGAHFQNLPPEAQGVLEASYENKIRERIEFAMSDAYSRARDAVANLAKGLGGENFMSVKSAAIEHVRELPPMLRSWNLGNSENLDTLATDIEKLVAGEDMKSLKANENVRRFVVKEANRIVAMIDDWDVIRKAEEEDDD